MEVHHHSHTPRQKWSHYVWEFLMLFLAVFCGSLAEYQLEHKIEKDREKQFIRSLVKELEADTASANFVIKDSSRVAGLDSIPNAIYGKNFQTIDARYVYLIKRKYISIANLITFGRNTISQLKNAGNMRLIRKQNVVDSIIFLDIVMTQIETMSADYMSMARKNLEFGTALFDDGYYREDGKFKGPYRIMTLKEPPKFLTDNYNLLIEFANRAGQQSIFLANYHRQIQGYLEHAGGLIALIKREYKIK